jgi:hypothetical protein
MNRKVIVFTIIFGLFAIIGAVVLFYPQRQLKNELDAFAQCLSEKGIVMYGAEWCSHCQEEKNAFGNSFRLVSYVECTKNPKECLAAGIVAYPTWVFPDGKNLVGKQGVLKLSKESQCPLPASITEF